MAHDHTQRSPDRAEDAGSRPTLIERLRSLFGRDAHSIRDDFEEAIDATAMTEAFSPQERAMLKSVLRLHQVRVDDVMVPRADIISVGLDATLGEVLSVFRTAGHSRLPTHGDTLDDPRGMVHIRDFVDFLATRGEAGAGAPGDRGRERLGEIDLTMSLSSAAIQRPVLFAPPSMPALDLLVRMQASRTHMALVIDEYGGTDGLVSMEDIVEVIVGDIEDEHDDEADPVIEAMPDGTFMVDARASLEAVSAATGVDLGQIAHGEAIDTLGGLVTATAGRVPVRGEIVALAPVEFEILDADPRRVKRARVHLRRGVEGDAEAGAAPGQAEGAPAAPPPAPPAPKA